MDIQGFTHTRRGATEFIAFLKFILDPDGMKEVKRALEEYQALADATENSLELTREKEKELTAREQEIERIKSGEATRTQAFNIEKREFESNLSVLEQRSLQLDVVEKELNQRDATLEENERRTMIKMEELKNAENEVAKRESAVKAQSSHLVIAQQKLKEREDDLKRALGVK